MGYRSPCEGAILRGMACPDMPDDTDVNCARTAKPIKMLFGLWTRPKSPMRGAVIRGMDMPDDTVP